MFCRRTTARQARVFFSFALACLLAALICHSHRSEMKELVGIPGTWSSLALRVSQCVCAAATLVTMAIARGDAYTAYSFLIAAMQLQLFWSFIFACIDIHSLRTNLDLRHDHVAVFRFLCIDTVLSLLTWASASASAGVTILLDRDVHFCEAFPHLSCGQYKLFVILAFMTWSFAATSAFSMFWLLVSPLG
ncbi:hypothetical protein EJB05_44516 [Eragrostis curvula]|uniref:CASP-like protein n=1 Tax=Eragrostis curvula TaxID=38414 RepID=A0A5J9THW1_9POAL|nr:hypothetical protein EJB05_44516 [Eragrostis curvula]